MKIATWLSTTAVLALALVPLQGCDTADGEEKCPGDTATVIVTLTLPTGIAGTATLSGPNGYTTTLDATDTLSGLAAGEYKVTYKRIKTEGAVVGKAYYGKISEPTFTLTACKTKTVSVEYLQEPGSERAYVIANSAIQVFSAAQLAATGSPTAVNTLKSPPTPRGLAFDAWGNLWFSNTEGVFMYAMEDLAKTNPDYRVKLTGEGVMGAAIPGAGPLAFDDEGNLWVGQIASNRVVRLTKAQLAATGSPTPALTLAHADLNGVEALAFDADGNLWATNSVHAVVKFAKARLSASQSSAADVSLIHMSGPLVIGVYSQPTSLAFDAAGNLWIGYFGGNELIKVPKAALAVSDTIQPPNMVLNGSVLALLEGLAFDGGGGAWVPGKAGNIIRVAPTALTASGDMTAGTVITSPQVDFADDIAFNPAPEALPLRD